MKTIAERFWGKVDRRGDENCWLWLGTKFHARNGDYGRLCIAGKSTPAHRVAYRLLVGPIPEGLVLDHLCRNTLCVNPRHLEVVTNKTNLLRGVNPPAQNARKATCKYGHPLTGNNVLFRKRTHSLERKCRACRRAWNNAARAKVREAQADARKAKGKQPLCPRCKRFTRWDDNLKVWSCVNHRKGYQDAE